MTHQQVGTSFWEQALRGLALAAIAVWLGVLAGSLTGIGKPFAGFAYGPRLSVWLATAPEWNGPKAGLVPLDRILRADGKPVARAGDLDRLVAAVPVGTRITYDVRRLGKVRQVAVPTERFGLRDFVLAPFLYLVLSLAFLAIAILPFWVKPSDLAAQACLLVGVSAGATFALCADWGGAHLFGNLLRHAGMAVPFCALLLGLAFPEPVPWLRRRPWLASLVLAPAIVVPPLLPTEGSGTLVFVWSLTLCALAVMLLSLVKRSAGAASPVARARAGIVLTGAFLAAFPLISANMAMATWPGGDLAGFLPRLGLAFSPLFPAAVAFAILKHRLFELEATLERALVYGTVIVALGSAYFVLAALFRLGIERTLNASVTWLGDAVATALVTLSFIPLRNHVRAWVDRRFYRASYDFKTVLGSFSEAVRTTLDPQEVAAAFLDAAQGAVHPAYLAVVQSEPGGHATIVATRGKVPPDLAGRLTGPCTGPPTGPGTEPPPGPLPGGMSFPLQFRDQDLGAILVGPPLAAQDYEPQDRLLLRTMSREVGVRLRAAQLHAHLDNLVRDRTRELEEALVQQRSAFADLQQVDRLKTAFIGSMTHELMTPVSELLQLSASLTESAGTGKDSLRFANRIQTVSRQVERLVDDLLELARIDSGHLSLQMVDLDLDALLGDILATFEESAAGKGVMLGLDIPQDAAVVRGDEVRVIQTIGRLMENAIRHTPAGGAITLRAAGEPGAMRIEVEDTGCGIAPEAYAGLFTRFYRLNPGQVTENPGLGLAIARGLVEAQGGHLEFSSEVGRGSRFWFRLRAVGDQDPVARLPMVRSPGDAGQDRGYPILG